MISILHGMTMLDELLGTSGKCTDSCCCMPSTNLDTISPLSRSYLCLSPGEMMVCGNW